MKTTTLVMAALFIFATSSSMAAGDYSKRNKAYKSSTSNSQNINNRPTSSSDPFARDDVSGMPRNPRTQPQSNIQDPQDFGRRAMETDEIGDAGVLRR